MQSADLRSRSRAIESWFLLHQRPLPWRTGYDPYHVWVSEVMLQQTRMEVVLPYFERFLSKFPDLVTLARATDDEVTAAWSGLGYYRRARMLRAGAAFVVEHYGGRIPQSVEELLTLPGVGRYTAGAIASVAFEQRAPIVDGNVARVTARLFGDDTAPWGRATELVNSSASPRALNQGLMELGALVCLPRNPSCLLCPVQKSCVALAMGRIDELPRPKPKKTARELRIPLYLIRDRRGRLLMRRERGALMHAMYHLPHGDASLFEDPLAGAVPGPLLGTFRHTVTNRKIEFTVYEAKLRGRKGSYEWIDPDDLHAIPHPSYVKKALALKN